MSGRFTDIESRSLGTPLYHYTSLEVFAQIMNTEKMFASHAAYMNDGSELEYGFDILKGFLREKISSLAGREKAIVEAILSLIDAQSIPETPVFLLSFSENGNLLSQWQAYTPHGRGISIGFDHVALIQRSIRAGWVWRGCRYKTESQKAWVEVILTRILSEAASATMLSPSDAALQTFTNLRGELYSVAACVKHPAFAAEVEWRLVSPPIDLKDKRVKFRSGRTTLIPYVEFELCDKECPNVHIAECWIGPTTNVNHTSAVINAIRWQAGITGPIAIRNSQIPFRQI